MFEEVSLVRLHLAVKTILLRILQQTSMTRPSTMLLKKPVQ
jgi:hypothetical protein